jgi:cellulose synthase operon protein B
MKTISRLAAASLFLAALLPTPSYAQARSDAQLSQPDPVIRRNITVAELGFAEGAHFGSLGGGQEFFFPVPRAAHATSGTLSFAYDEAAPFDGRRSVLVTVGERTVVSHALPVGHDRQVIDVPLLPEDFAGDFVKVTVRYSGVVTNDRCVDLRLANDRFSVLPETTLALDVPADRLNEVSTAVTLMPPKIAVGIPERKLTEQEMAAAISAVRLFKTRGHQVEVVPLAQLLGQPSADNPEWKRGDVIVASPADLGTMSVVEGATSPSTTGSTAKASVVGLADGPGLLLSGSDPQPAVNFLGSDWRDAGTGSVIRVGAIQPRERPGDRLTFDQLGIATPVSDTPGEAVWTAGFRATDLPSGRWPTALDLDIGIGTDGSDVPAVANIFLNGRFLAGTTASKDGITHLHAVIPHGLVSLDNQVRVVVQRQPRAGDCTYLPASFPSQLLGSSAIELGEAEAPAHDFFALAQQARNQLTVFVRDNLSPAGQRTALQVLAAAAADLAPADTPVVVKRIQGDSISTPGSAFIAWGDFRFADSAVPVRVDQGNVLVRTRSGAPLFNLNDARNTLIAQLVTLPDAPSGLWLRSTGADGAIPAPQTIALDRGNVAFIGPAGVTLALSTERDRLIEVAYPDAPSWQVLVRRYGTWLLLAAWLVITVAMLVALQRMYSRRERAHKEP